VHFDYHHKAQRLFLLFLFSFLFSFGFSVLLLFYETARCNDDMMRLKNWAQLVVDGGLFILLFLLVLLLKDTWPLEALVFRLINLLGIADQVSLLML
jgi:hypothetical protein